jgi:hypothetical protein
MKKLVLLLAFAMFSLGAAAQADNMQKDKMKQDQGMMHKGKDHVMMKDGKMMVMKDGKSMAMDKDMALSNGATVSTNGTVTMKDGKTSMMKEGDRMDMDGNMMPSRKMKKEEPKMN